MEGVEVNPQFWRGKKVFVTGHTGFKGSWLSILLQSSVAEVVGFPLPPPTQPKLFARAGGEQGRESIGGDVRDFGHVRKVLQQHPAEIVFHMAAQALVRHSYADPVGTYATNVSGTVHLLSAVREVPQVKVVVVVTSDKCYQNDGKPQAFRESDPMGGFDPYSSSKGCAELATAAFRSSFFNRGPKSPPPLPTPPAGTE